MASECPNGNEKCLIIRVSNANFLSHIQRNDNVSPGLGADAAIFSQETLQWDAMNVKTASY